MALGSTVYKATLDISDLDRGYYATHVLTVARHPSETEERLMLRILAFASLAGEHLEFGRGLSTEGEPALWEIDDTGTIERWIEVGCPDVRQVRRAAGRSNHVTVLAYGEDRVGPWWQSVGRRGREAYDALRAQHALCRDDSGRNRVGQRRKDERADRLSVAQARGEPLVTLACCR